MNCDLDEALALRATDGADWLAFADPRYESINGMFGGWTVAILLRAIVQSTDRDATPSAITVNFVDKIASGIRVVVRPRILGGGRTMEHWQAGIVADGDDTILAHAMAVVSERRPTDAHTEPMMPDVPDPKTLGIFHPPGPQGERMDARIVSGSPPFGRNGTSSLHWAREMSGRRVDHIQLAFLSDAYAPRSWFWSDGPRVNATMTLSVYFHATVEEISAVGDDYILNEAIGTRGTNSTSGQQARLWSRGGRLLATTEQLCWYR